MGNYAYEYDSNGRVSVKSVSYGKSDNGGLFTSYRVMVDYADGLTNYTKYEMYDSDYIMTEQWSVYDNGKTASHTFYSNGNVEKKYQFDTLGNITYHGDSYSAMAYSGALNDSTIVTYEVRDGADIPLYAEFYKYSDGGKILEGGIYNLSTETVYDSRKYEYTYDEFGRITSIKYYDVDENDANVSTGTDSTLAAPRRARQGEPVWVLSSDEVYTYFNDEVYAIGNSWHDVFGFDGPLTSIKRTDYLNGYENSTETYSRDASGKLTGVTVNMDNSSAVYDFSIDAEGRITGYTVNTHDDYGGGQYADALETIVYTWEGEQLVHASYKETYSDSYGYTQESAIDSDYEYGEHSVSTTTTNSVTYSDGSTYSYTEVEHEQQSGNRYTYEYVDMDNPNYKMKKLREVQTEDLSFVLPNVLKDYDGFVPDSTIIVSVAGRVVNMAYNDDDGYIIGFYGLEDLESGEYNNVTVDGYFAISHVGEYTVCRDALDRPVYILQNGRLVREYVYDVALSHVGSAEGVRSKIPADIAPAEGYAYEEITYLYADNGLPVGRSYASVDESGVRTEDLTIEYKYDETTGIAVPQLSATAGVTLNGRTLGIAEGSVFSVFDVQGRLIAANTTHHTFAAAGVYVVTVNGNSFKLSVR